MYHTEKYQVKFYKNIFKKTVKSTKQMRILNTYYYKRGIKKIKRKL